MRANQFAADTEVVLDCGSIIAVDLIKALEVIEVGLKGRGIEARPVFPKLVRRPGLGLHHREQIRVGELMISADFDGSGLVMGSWIKLSDAGGVRTNRRSETYDDRQQRAQQHSRVTRRNRKPRL